MCNWKKNISNLWEGTNFFEYNGAMLIHCKNNFQKLYDMKNNSGWRLFNRDNLAVNSVRLLFAIEISTQGCSAKVTNNQKKLNIMYASMLRTRIYLNCPGSKMISHRFLCMQQKQQRFSYCCSQTQRHISCGRNCS